MQESCLEGSQSEKVLVYSFYVFRGLDNIFKNSIMLLSGIMNEGFVRFQLNMSNIYFKIKNTES